MISPRAESFKKDINLALKKELEIARKMSQAERSNEAISGTFIKNQSNNFVYEFENLTGFPPDEGVQVSFSVGEKHSNGKYLGEVNSKFLFEFDTDFGETISRVTVVSDPLFLLEKQIDLLEKTSPFENELALASLGLADYPATSAIMVDSKFMHGLNGLQRETLEVVSANPITYIWGPPGTGKTTTMGSVVAALADSGLRVLLVSNTNLALDTALERCLDRFSEFSDLKDGLMLRLGTIVKPELINKYSKEIELDGIHGREVKALQDEMHLVSQDLGKLRNELSDLNDLRREFEKAKLGAKGLASLSNEISKLKSDIETARSSREIESQKISKFEEEFRAAVAKNSISRFFSGTKNPDLIRREIQNSQNKKEKFETEIIAKERESQRLESKTIEVEKSIEVHEKWLLKNPKAEKELEKIEDLEKSTNELQNRIEKIKKEVSNKRNEILARARVVACTAFKTILDTELAKQKFDCVVVDEASMLTLPLYYCAASLASDRIVIAGDFRQLPPIVRIGSMSGLGTNEDEVDRLKTIMSTNPFIKSGVIAKGGNPKELVALRDQYRMRESISDLISTNFYPEHTLRTVSEKLDKPTPWGNEPFIFVETSSIEPESSTVNGKSRRNVAHALVVRALVEELYREGWTFDSTGEKTFAVITPYAKQSTFIENLVGATGEIQVKGGISTVHRFQGNERDLIILDLTKVSSTADPGLGDFLGNPDPMAPQNAMWNVAISRARQHLIVVGHKQTLDKNSNSLISHLVNSMKIDMKVLDASTLIDIEVARKPIPSADKGSIAWFTGESFYDSFKSDLKKTKSKLLLASPFSTESGTSRWIETFKNLKNAEVELICLTKPLDEKSNMDESSKIHQELELLFKEVRTIPKMHEKIAVIDSRIVWLGSLNILSHKNASEIMMRVESPDFAKSIIDEYLLQRSPGKRGPALNADGSAVKAGDPCKDPSCQGVMVLRPAGVSKKSGRPYSAFFSCNQFPRCKFPN
jgi:superfamily I DNA and/or RNA helicase